MMDGCIPLKRCETCKPYVERRWMPHCGADNRHPTGVLARVHLSRQHDHEDAATVPLNVGRGHTEETYKVLVVLRLQGAVGAWLAQPWRFDQIFKAYVCLPPARRCHFHALNSLAAESAAWMPMGWSTRCNIGRSVSGTQSRLPSERSVEGQSNPPLGQDSLHREDAQERHTQQCNRRRA